MDLGDVDGVGEVIVAFLVVRAGVSAVFRHQPALHEHGGRLAAVQGVYNLHIGDIAGSHRTQIVKAILTGGIKGGKLNGFTATDTGLHCLADHLIDVAHGQQVLGMNVIGADGNHVLPLMVPASGHQGLEIVNEGAGPEIHVDAAAQFFHHFLRRGTLVVAARAAQTVGRQLFPGDVGGVALEVHAPLDAFTIMLCIRPPS